MALVLGSTVFTSHTQEVASWGVSWEYVCRLNTGWYNMKPAGNRPSLGLLRADHLPACLSLDLFDLRHLETSFDSYHEPNPKQR